MQAGTLFQVRNGSGEEVLSYTPECSYSSVAFSSPDMNVGETYTITYGENSAELTIDSTAMSAGSSGGTSGMQPGGMGNMRPRDAESTDSGSFSDRERESDSERPTLPDGEMDNPQQQNDNSNFARPGHSCSESGSISGSTESNSEGTYHERTDRPSGNGEQMTAFSPDAEPVSSTTQAVSSGTALNEISSTVWLLLGASVFVLTAAIVFAIHYRKH